MNDDTNINPMDEQDSKKRAIGLAMIGVVIAGLCALFIMAFLWFQPDQPALFAKYFPSPTPTRTPKPTPTPVFEPITITAHEDFSSNYLYLEDLATGWESPLLPSKLAFHLEVNQDQPVAVSRGWCTTTEAILKDNLTHIEWLLEADGKSIDVDTLYRSKFVDNTMACEGYDGWVEKWTEGEHTISLTLRIDQEIYDGWGVFPAGEYIEIFIINVTR